MQEVVIPMLSTLQDLEQAIQQFKASDRWGADSFSLWQAIRDAALELRLPEAEGDRVPGEDSY